MNRPIDYYIKHLPFKVRQEIFRLMEEINPVRVKDLIEKPIEYPGLKMRGYSDAAIEEYIEDAQQDFMNVNICMNKNNRPSLFSDPCDTYRSSIEYNDLMKKKTPDELVKQFGCTWDDYVPIILHPLEEFESQKSL